MKYVLRYYRSGHFTPEAAKAAFPAHQAHYRGFQERGLLLLIGPMVNPPGEALAVLTTRQAAEEFVAADPFVLTGLVVDWSIQEWREALLEPT